MKKKRILLLAAFGALLAIVILLIYAFFISPNQKITETPMPASVSKETPKKSESLPVQTIQQYDAENLRDPFSPLIVKRQIGQRAGSPLETYDVEELKLTGIVFDKKGAFALIQTPDGKFHIAKEKDKIGISGGMITKIGKDFIEIKESPAYGGLSPKTKQLKLRTEE